jgi:hypothetical protein
MSKYQILHFWSLIFRIIAKCLLDLFIILKKNLMVSRIHLVDFVKFEFWSKFMNLGLNWNCNIFSSLTFFNISPCSLDLFIILKMKFMARASIWSISLNSHFGFDHEFRQKPLAFRFFVFDFFSHLKDL